MKTLKFQTFKFYIQYSHGNFSRGKFKNIRARDLESATDKAKASFERVVSVDYIK